METGNGIVTIPTKLQLLSEFGEGITAEEIILWSTCA